MAPCGTRSLGHHRDETATFAENLEPGRVIAVGGNPLLLRAKPIKRD
jgi:hypothetical protein